MRALRQGASLPNIEDDTGSKPRSRHQASYAAETAAEEARLPTVGLITSRKNRSIISPGVSMRSSLRAVFASTSAVLVRVGREHRHVILVASAWSVAKDKPEANA